MHDLPFRHLPLPVPGRYRAKFPQGRVKENALVKENLTNRDKHVKAITQSLDDLTRTVETGRKRWVESGLPAISASAGFLMQIPEGTDVDQFAHDLGVELVAEAEGGYLLAATQDLSFRRLKEVLAKFESHSGGVMAASILGVFNSRMITAALNAYWILTYLLFGILRMTNSTYLMCRFSVLRAPAVSPFQRSKRGKTKILKLFSNAGGTSATKQWKMRMPRGLATLSNAEQRYGELHKIVAHYGGQMLTGLQSDPHSESNNSIHFPDSFQARIKMGGDGWKDIILNLPTIFEVALPDDLEQPLPSSGVCDTDDKPEVIAPPESSPAVCVIDSGIQEGHLWLESAVDWATSRCFIPGADATAVNDEVPGGGHGTRVAGAVLYPSGIPKRGSVQAPFWLQNARVLGEDNKWPENLSPARYIVDVVRHFTNTPKRTRIFNHSIAGDRPCQRRRMSAWATKIDELSHNNGILFIQAAGNILTHSNNPFVPGVLNHLRAGREYPDYLMEQASRIANPAQSLNALTVGSVACDVWEGPDRKSFATERLGPSAFSRSGFGIWDTIKPEVVEIGGDYVRMKEGLAAPTVESSTAVELLRAAGDGGPAFASDHVGTSYSTPKVAHLAARLQGLLPDASSLLYRGLIVHSARWPDWVSGSGWSNDRTLSLLGFGLPNVERATTNAPHRITMITENATELRTQELHFYRIQIPPELRNRALDTMLRIDVTLSYSSTPRRTRSSRNGYLATWLDWQSSGRGQPIEDFRKRMLSNEERPPKGARRWRPLPWQLRTKSKKGESKSKQRGNGTVQKDWAKIAAHDMPEEFCIAVRGHQGWDHREQSGRAKYCLVVSVEAEDLLVPVYEAIAAVNVEIRSEVEAVSSV